MPAFDKTNKFLNSREWRSFLSAASSASSYPRVVRAVRAGQAWFSAGAFDAAEAAAPAGRHSGWLLVESSLVPEPVETLRI